MTERNTKDFSGLRHTSWSPRLNSRPLENPFISSFSQSNPASNPSPGLPVRPTPIIIKFNKHTHGDQATTVFLHNPNDLPILFKVRIKAPKRYGTELNSGLIEPGQFLTVRILLWGLPQASQELNGSQHGDDGNKFLVQSYTIIPGETVPGWGLNFKNRKCAEVKMRVQFRKEEPGEEGVAPNQRARAGSF
jgi:hypothetical protein